MISCQLLSASVVFSAEAVKAENKELSLQEIALPSEVTGLGKQSGTIYYNTSVKNKVLVPAHFWGEVQKPGLHFIPTDTTLIKGLSMAGGPSGAAKIDDVVLTRSAPDGSLKQFEFDLSEGGDTLAYQFKIESGDSVFIRKDLFREDRAYYTSLVAIAVSVLSTVILLQKVNK